MAEHLALTQCVCWSVLVLVCGLVLHGRTSDTDSVSVLLVIVCDPDLTDIDSECVGLC